MTKLVRKKVYVINKSGHDFQMALQHGDIVYLSSGKQFSRYDVNSIFREFLDILKDSNPKDYLLLTGLPVMQGIAIGIMLSKHKCANLLQFKQRKDGSKFYLERNITVEDWKDEN